MATATDHWPTERPTLTTERLLLRPFTADDEARLVELASDRRVADTTEAVPHPYGIGHARDWIAGHPANWAQRKSLAFAVCLRAGGELTDELIGVVGLAFALEHERAELGYWIGVPYWNHGYATEAAGAVVRYGLDILRLDRIHARHLDRNPASARVLAKIGMQREGHLRRHVRKWDRPEDVTLHAILRHAQDDV